MYSQPGGRPGQGRQGRYIKGRLPEGVDFAQYPGRSSTPLPTAESKSAERINQLKIWNEAAAGSALKPGASQPQANRRTDSFKDARERHSSSFQDGGAGGVRNGIPPEKKRIPRDDIYADRSDDDDDDDDEEEELEQSTTNHFDPHTHVTAATGAPMNNVAPAPAAPPRTSPPPHPTHVAPTAASGGTGGGGPSTAPGMQAKESKGCCVLM